MNNIDLHIHTKYSDGEYDEYQIIDKVKESGITEFAICDHDTIDGSMRVFGALKSLNITDLKFHTGTELSCRLNEMFGGINVHILVRDFDYNNPKLLALISEIREKRKHKIQLMVNRVKEVYGIDLPQEEIADRLRATSSVGKPHIYYLLCQYGDFDREEYYKNMRDLPSADLKLNCLSVLSLLKNEKCNITLAHPKEIMDEYDLSYEDIDALVSYLKPLGLDGLEVGSSKHSFEDGRVFEKIADKQKLIKTAGSDYHGPHVKPNVRIGLYNTKGNIV